MLLIKNNEVSRGYRMLQNAAEDSPKDPTIQLHLGQALIQQEKFADAQAVLSALIEASPDTSSADEAKALLESMPRQ